jgi:hypothetical protein
VGLPAIFYRDSPARYPTNPDKLTTGWRWWRILNNKLFSPLVPFTNELAASGEMDGVFFIPKAENIIPVVEMLAQQRSWYQFAISYGKVTGPFAKDGDTWRTGSMVCAKYQTKVILTNCVVSQGFKLAYPQIPIVNGIVYESLLALEYGRVVGIA